MLAATPLCALWNRGASSWSVEETGYLGALVVVGLVVGATGAVLSSRQDTTSPTVARRISGPVLLASLYPLSVVVPLVLWDSTQVFFGESDELVRTLGPVCIAAAIGAVPMLCALVPDLWKGFFISTAVWSVLTALLLPIFLFGLVFLPLALANWAEAVRPRSALRKEQRPTRPSGAPVP